MIDKTICSLCIRERLGNHPNVVQMAEGAIRGGYWYCIVSRCGMTTDSECPLRCTMALEQLMAAQHEYAQ